MAAISKELREMSQQPWFPIIMQELGYEPIKHGKWEKKGISIKGIEKEFCSECKTWSYGRSKMFCPNCGAIMDGGEDG